MMKGYQKIKNNIDFQIYKMSRLISIHKDKIKNEKEFDELQLQYQLCVKQFQYLLDQFNQILINIQQIQQIQQQSQIPQLSIKDIKKQQRYSDSSMSSRYNLTSKKNIFNQINIYMGQILRQDPGDKQYLKQIIQEFKNKKFVHSVPLYRYDNQNKANFHKYFDNQSDILLIIVLQNGYKIAAFTQDKFDPQQSPQDRGIIISLTNRKSFYCKPGKKSISYNRQYIIFGNSQIRIPKGQNQLFSNFAISNCFYDNKDNDVSVLLGNGKSRNATISHYQIFSINFQDI